MAGAHLLVMQRFHLSDLRHRPRILAGLAAAGVVLILIMIGTYGLIAGPSQPAGGEPDIQTDMPSSSTPSPSPSATGQNPPSSSPSIPAVRESADPIEFARNVATSLFSWDTSSGLGPLDYTAPLLAVGDPSGDEQAGLASDIAGYLPSRQAWSDLRGYGTAQEVTIESATVPDAWNDAVAQARPGQLAQGTTAVTIDVTRHRTGTWQRRAAAANHPVSLTVFVVCQPTYETCRLLRLSQPDTPLR